MSSGLSGFQNAPVTRAFVVATTAVSVMFAARGRPSALALTYEDVFKNFRLWKLFSSIFAFSSTPELLFGLYLLYYFRVFERQIGSNKYSVFVLFSTLVSLLLEALTLTLLKDRTLKMLSSGPYGLIFSSFVPFFFDVPVSSRMRIFGIRVSDKSFTYLAGLQLVLSSWKSSLLPGVCGVVVGLLYRANIFGIHHARLPGFVVSFFSRLFPSSPGSGPRSSLSRGHVGRDMPRFSGRLQATFPAPAAVEPPEDSIAMLVSMGFNTSSARQALVRARNDINVATNILLEAQSH